MSRAGVSRHAAFLLVSLRAGAQVPAQASPPTQQLHTSVTVDVTADRTDIDGDHYTPKTSRR